VSGLRRLVVAVHSGHARTVADVPAAGQPVLIRLRVRRLLCRDLACPVVTFAEHVAGLTATGITVRHSG